ncbi:DinB family protein [Chloroflexota bacterium]
MDTKDLILRSLDQSQDYLTKALDGLDQNEIAWSPVPGCNNIAFILWHTTRVEDFWINRVILREKELYESKAWQDKLGTPAKAFGYTEEELRDWPVPPLSTLGEYARSVREKTLAVLKSMPTDKLSELARPDRPDTLGSILCRMVTEIALHVGQIAYLRGAQRGLDK